MSKILFLVPHVALSVITVREYMIYPSQVLETGLRVPWYFRIERLPKGTPVLRAGAENGLEGYVRHSILKSRLNSDPIAQTATPLGW